jgi:hypothetical protein
VARPVFPDEIQLALLSEGHPAAVCGMCSDHAQGLLHAISAMASRMPAWHLPVTGDAVEARASLAALVTQMRQIAQRLASPEQTGIPVFTESEREHARRHKYLRNYSNLTLDDLRAVLRSLAEYSRHARQWPLYRPPSSDAGPLVGVNRCLHAHNAMLAFYAAPFTDDEYVEDLHHAVLSKLS